MNTLRKLKAALMELRADCSGDTDYLKGARDGYLISATRLSAELPKWERVIEAAKELLHARSKGCTEVAGYDDDGHPLTREGVASKNLRAALKEIEQ